MLIARALAQEAPLIVMDEPTASLDFGNQARCWRRSRASPATRGQGGQGVILSTHDPDQALGLSARVLAMSGGHLLADGKAADVLTPQLLSRLYGVPLTVETTGSGRRICVPLAPLAQACP